MNHTPGPWRLEEFDVVGGHGASCHVATVNMVGLDFESLAVVSANAQFIVTACNAHEELVKIAQAYRNHLKVSSHTDGEVATYHHIEDVLNTIEKEA